MKLARGFLTVGGMTMLSRIMGIFREVLIAATLGASDSADAFFAAFRLPNLFRRIFGEGAFSLAFVPLFTKRLEDGDAEARRFGEESLALLASILFVLTLIATAVMPGMMYLMVAGFAEDPAKFDQAVFLARIMFPYLMLISLTALFSAVLNALGKFAVAAGAPILLNICAVIAILLAISAGAANVAVWLSVGVLIAGFAQLALVVWAARKAGMRFTLSRPKWTPGMKQLLLLAAPAALAGGAMQINLVVGSVIASFFDGAVAWLSYSDRLYQLPLGVVGVAVGIVLMPELAKRVKQNDRAAAQDSMTRSIEFALALTIPAAIALTVISTEIASAVFERGAFTAMDARQTGLATALFALGLPAFVLVKVFTPGYFAEEDSKTPLRLSLIAVGVNTALSLLGAYLFGWLAIPVATAIAAWLNAAMLWRGLAGNGYVIEPMLRRRVIGMVAASVVMGIALIGVTALAAPLMESGWLRVPVLLGLIALGVGVYGVAAQLMGGVDMRRALRR